MGNVQGRKHKRRKKSGKRKHVKCDKLVFVDRDDGEYIWETHVVGRLPFREPEEPEIVFHCDQLWQDDDDDGWSTFVLIDKDDANELSDVEIIEI
jgi:hypothetical protein